MRISDWSSVVCSSDLGFTFERRVETAYDQFCKQAKIWLSEDPDAKISILGIGFSRGAEEVAALLRMNEERGIQDATGADRKSDVSGKGVSLRVDFGGRRIIKKKSTYC